MQAGSTIGPILRSPASISGGTCACARVPIAKTINMVSGGVDRARFVFQGVGVIDVQILSQGAGSRASYEKIGARKSSLS